MKPLARGAPALAVGLLLAGRAAPTLSAQNILVNPDFDTSLDGWQPLPMLFWDGSVDADGSPTSGSAKANFSGFPTAGDYPVISQCVSLTSGDSYALGGKILIDDNSFDTKAYFTVTLFPVTGCTGAPLSSTPIATPAVTTFKSWVTSVASFTNGSAQSALFSAVIFLSPGSSFEGNFDDTFVIANGCVPDAQTLCLQNLRFKVVATFAAGAGAPSPAQLVPVGNSGYMWFFTADEIEAMVKVVNGCSLNDEFWVFAAGLTNVKVVISVTDTVSGLTKTYTNPANTAFQPMQDTSAFPCP